MRKLPILFLSVGLLSFLQSFGFSIFGVKPNLALVAVIAASFFVANFWQGLLLIALAGLILKFAPGFEKEIMIFSLIGAGAVIIKNRLPWHQFLSNLTLIALGILIFYVILAPNLILSPIFLKELFLNLILGILIFAFFSFLWQNKTAWTPLEVLVRKNFLENFFCSALTGYNQQTRNCLKLTMSYIKTDF